MKFVIGILLIGLYADSTHARLLGTPSDLISALLDSPLSPAYTKSRPLGRGDRGKRVELAGVQPSRRPCGARGKLRRFRVNSKHYRGRRVHRRKSSAADAAAAPPLGLSTLAELMDLIGQTHKQSPSSAEESPIQLVANVVGSMSDNSPSALLPSLISRLVSESKMANSPSTFSYLTDVIPALSSLILPSSANSPDSTQPDPVDIVSDPPSETRGEKPCEASTPEPLELIKADIDAPNGLEAPSKSLGSIGQPAAESSEDALLSGLMDLLLSRQEQREDEVVNLKLDPPRGEQGDTLYDSLHENTLDNIEDNRVSPTRPHRYKKGRLYPSQHGVGWAGEPLSSEAIVQNLFAHSPSLPARGRPASRRPLSTTAEGRLRLATRRHVARRRKARKYTLVTPPARKKKQIFPTFSEIEPLEVSPLLPVDRNSETDQLFDLYLSQQALKAKLSREKRQKTELFAQRTPYIPSQLRIDSPQAQTIDQREYRDITEHSMGYIDYNSPYFIGQIPAISYAPAYMYQPIYVPPPPIDYQYLNALPYKSELEYINIPPPYDYSQISLPPPQTIGKISLPPPQTVEKSSLTSPSAGGSSRSSSSGSGESYGRASGSEGGWGGEGQTARRSAGSEASAGRKTRIELNVINSPTTELIVQPSSPQPNQDCFDGNCDQLIAAEIKNLMAGRRLV